MQWLLLFVLAGLGASLRYAFSTKFNGEGFPYGTFSVNVLGSLAIGMLFANPAFTSNWSPGLRMALIVGFLGALTTFSSFSMELVSLAERGKWSLAALYFFLSNAVAFSCCLLGYRLFRA